jgi:hypothetical protein
LLLNRVEGIVRAFAGMQNNRIVGVSGGPRICRNCPQSSGAAYPTARHRQSYS